MENRRSPNAPKITTNAPIVQLSCTIKSVDVSVAVLGVLEKKAARLPHIGPASQCIVIGFCLELFGVEEVRLALLLEFDNVALP